MDRLFAPELRGYAQLYPATQESKRLLDLVSQPLSDTTLVLRVSGRVDASTSGAIRDVWQSRPRLQTLMVNLAQVAFIDSKGVTTLVDGIKHLREKGGDLILVDPSPTVRMILELTAMDRIVRVADSVDDVLGLPPAA